MSFVVSARKYRPRQFDEVIGQDHIAQTLKNAFENDKLAHAFLFSGPRGVGKTTSARILARVLNCENVQDKFKSCGECNSCKSFDENASFNIFELDAASNNSVDHIRSLNDQVRFQPQQGKYKIYIIDEVHMLSPAAFNAFLKTLEEPPPYAKFILATTEKHKIIPTILSRCQIFDFKRIQIKDIVTQLQSIATLEERKIEEDAFHLIGQKADGAMRDALSIYDKIVSATQGDITLKDVADNLNVLDYDYYFRLTDACIREDLPTNLNLVAEVMKKGFEVEQFIQGLMEHLRNLLLVKNVETTDLLEVGENLKKRYHNQAEITGASFLLTSLSILNEVDINLIRSQSKRLSLEIAIGKMAYMNRVIDKKKTTEPSVNKIDLDQNLLPKPNTKTNVRDVETILDSPPASKVPEKTKKTDLTIDQAKEAIEEASEPKKIQQSPNKTNVASSLRSITPMISTDIDSLINEIQDEQDRNNKNTNPFTTEFVTKEFNTWKDKVDSKSLTTAIDYSRIEVEGEEKIIIYCPSQIYVDFIKQENELIEHIHGLYAARDIIFSFEVDPDKFPKYEPPKAAKFLSVQEKFDILLQKNENFNLLVDAMKLKPK